ncbi:MAG: endopeptidase La [Gemmatimonadales bacterium]|jgi:ATP-dependent Lon protease|nr:MAG: endopeptidase La [Gemmatimonadales bacterium]
MRLIRADETLEIPQDVPVVALRDLVFFPYMVLPLLIGRPRSLGALEEARDRGGHLLLLAQREASVEAPKEGDLFTVGTLARPVQVTTLPDGTSRVVLEGLGRARVEQFLPGAEHFRARVGLHALQEVEDPAQITADVEALSRSVDRSFGDYARLHDRVPSDLPNTLLETQDRVRKAHLISGHILLSPPEKQELLETPDLPAHLELLGSVLARELEILRIEERLDDQIRRQMDSDRKQIYLSEQLKAIQRELGSDAGEEWVELERQVEDLHLPDQARDRAERELGRLRKLNPVAPEAAVIRTYLDWILGLPWSGRSADNADVPHAAQVLEEAHFGLAEVKERILDYIAVLSLVGEMQGPILCLVGPPGVGKTSLGRSIARALGREFVRASLGGVRDEAEIRGHRRTYVGALPGRVIQGMRKVGTTNPVFLLDEVDKMARDSHGDPGAALLEVLDPEQNHTFQDHYLELDYDLSGVLFLATANTMQGIPEALRDRMEVIRLPGYLDTEKLVIAQRFLWPKHEADHGLPRDVFSLSDAAVAQVIRLYTREAGVRELGRQISRVARKLARGVAEGKTATGTARVIEPDDLRALLGPPPYLPPEEEEAGADRTGMANGLAWTSAGGEVLSVEVAAVAGSGEVRLTGTLGDIMKESAMAAVTYARSRARILGLAPDFHQNLDVHVHIPEGATPKDGPSAGITMAVALVSALTGVPSPAEVALTGEITLRGRVLGVGGIREKAVAALRSGITTMVLPAANVPELELLPQEVRDGIRFVPVRDMDQVLATALPGLNAAHGRELPDEPGISLSQ